MRDIPTGATTRLAQSLKPLSRKVGRVGSRVAERLGLPTEKLRSFQRRIYISLDNATLPDRVRQGELSRPRDRARLDSFERMVEEAFRGVEDPGDYVEFGVYFGRSLVRAYRALTHLDLVGEVRCIGFDSFEGMPKETAREAGPWVPGQYRSKRDFAISYLSGSGVDLSHVHLVEGWFSETLTVETAHHLNLSKISVAMIDCDIYSATKLALDFCAPRLAATSYIFLDDWSADGVPEGEGQKRAFREFLEHHPHLSTAFLGSYSSDSAVFQVRNG